MRYLFEISFNGTNYCGWQHNINAHVASVQEVLEDKLSILLRTNITVWGCGRTDKGVHAEKYFAHIEAEADLESSFIRKCNAILPPDISVNNMYRMPNGFHARYHARTRTYRYTLSLKKYPQKLLFQTYYDALCIQRVPDMEAAVHIIKNYKDFRTMCRTPDRNKHTFCTILDTQFTYLPDIDEIHIQITANRFLKSMMRMLVGYIVLIGCNTISKELFIQILEGKSEYKYHELAFPQGLSLIDVTYSLEMDQYRL